MHCLSLPRTAYLKMDTYLHTYSLSFLLDIIHLRWYIHGHTFTHKVILTPSLILNFPQKHTYTHTHTHTHTTHNTTRVQKSVDLSNTTMSFGCRSGVAMLAPSLEFLPPKLPGPWGLTGLSLPSRLARDMGEKLPPRGDACMYVCVYVCMYVYTCVCMRYGRETSTPWRCLYVCMYVCMYVRTYVFRPN